MVTKPTFDFDELDRALAWLVEVTPNPKINTDYWMDESGAMTQTVWNRLSVGPPDVARHLQLKVEGSAPDSREALGHLLVIIEHVAELADMISDQAHRAELEEQARHDRNRYEDMHADRERWREDYEQTAFELEELRSEQDDIASRLEGVEQLVEDLRHVLRLRDTRRPRPDAESVLAEIESYLTDVRF